MLQVNFISLAAASLFVLSNANAASLVEDVEQLQIKTKKIVKAVKTNRAAITVNAENIEINAVAIDTTNSAVSANSVDISSNANAVNSLATQVATMPLPVTYDYNNYKANNVSSKTFSMTSPSSSCGDTEVRTYARVVNGDVTNLKINRMRTVAGNICHNANHNYILTSGSRKLVSYEIIDYAGNLYSTNILSKPFTVAKSSMIEGKSFGGATGIKTQPVGGIPVLSGVFVNTVTVEGVQDVTVPAGTFTGCIKVHTVRNSTGLGNFNRYSWYCPGLGEVKRTQINPATSVARFWKLTSYTP